MKIGSFSFLKKCQGDGWGYVLASCHHKWSITWRWALWVRTGKFKKFCFVTARRFSKTRKWYSNIVFILPPWLIFEFQTQDNIQRKPTHWLHPIEELIEEWVNEEN